MKVSDFVKSAATDLRKMPVSYYSKADFYSVSKVLDTSEELLDREVETIDFDFNAGLLLIKIA